MKRTIFLAILFVFVISGIFHLLLDKGTPTQRSSKIANGLFAIYMPMKTVGLYTVKKKDNTVYIYHKESQDKGLSGFVFSINAFLKPSDYANIPGNKKLGELTDRKGKIYDIVVLYPGDKQINYASSYEAQNTYRFLKDSVRLITIKNVSGTKYYKDRGVKGELSYKNILKKHLSAVQEYWKPNKLQSENMSNLYAKTSRSIKEMLNSVGYAYYDINGDGIDELLIGENLNGKSIIYDIYTLVDRKPKHIVSSGNRNKFYICRKNFICNEYFENSGKRGLMVFTGVQNSSELIPQTDLRYDSIKNFSAPFYISNGNYISLNKYTNIPQEEFINRKNSFEYNKFDFKPLETLIKIK